MASVYVRQLKHGPVWYARVRTLEGRWISACMGLEGEKRAVALKAAALIQRKLDRGEQITGITDRRGHQPGTDLKTLSHLYLQDRARHWSPKTATSAELSLRTFSDVLGNVSIPAVDRQTVSRFLDKLSPRHLSPHSINLYLRNLRAFLNWCAESASVKGNWKPPKIEQIRADAPGHRDYYTKEEATKLLAAAQTLTINGRSLAPFLAFLMLTGMRYGESLACDWSWIDLRRGFVHIPAGKTKSNRSRSIPILPSLKRLLQALPEPHRGRVWPFSAGSGHLAARYREAVRRAGIRYLKLHNLRDTFAVNMLLSGVPLVVVSKILGHASINTTVKNYAALGDEELAVASAKGDKFSEGLLPDS
jgi:integrase